MASKTELAEYLGEHLRYEREMLGFTYCELHCAHKQPMWNALLESYAVHARTLYQFLRSNEDSRNHNADDYVPKHKADRCSAFDKLNTYVFHPTKQRLRDEKPDLSLVKETAFWIDQEWRRWAEALGEPFRSAADPTPACPPLLVVQTGAPSATNHITSAGSQSR